MSEEVAEQKVASVEQQNGGEAQGGEGDVERNAKRSRSDAFADDADGGEDRIPSPKRPTRSHEVLFRIVVPSNQIGRVIGREGSRIQHIREETKASIKIADAVARHEERVIIISSNDDNEVSYAEKALLHIASILKEDDGGIEISILGVQHVTSNVIRLLIAGSQAGCLIGKSGQTIAHIRNSSGATVTILDRNQLPLCASAHESDRMVQISGNMPEVLKALEIIGCQLRENPAKKVIARPTYGFNPNGANQTPLPQASADCVTSELMVAEALVGGLIGKGGYNISRIRNESGATIKVSGGRGEQDLRPIYFQGSPHQVALARKLVDDYIYSQSV